MCVRMRVYHTLHPHLWYVMFPFAEQLEVVLNLIDVPYEHTLQPFTLFGTPLSIRIHTT